MICQKSSNGITTLNIIIERGWWIFKWIETYSGTISAGWNKEPSGAPASDNTTIFLDRQAFEYWEQWT